jgi:hypothetical protein
VKIIIIIIIIITVTINSARRSQLVQNFVFVSSATWRAASESVREFGF